jgi:glycosyltransferase involved in cell wall biosynthesis
MVAWDLDPFRVGGGTSYAIRRLADQLVELGICVTILLPDWLDTPLSDIHPLLTLLPLTLPADLRVASHSRQCAEFCRMALEAAQQNHSSKSDVIIAHSDEGALFAILHRERGLQRPLVFWLHSLYDPSASDFPIEFQRCFPSSSVLGTALMAADLVVTSSGILQDAREFQWPLRLQPLQNALRRADDDRRVLTVESMGCLPEFQQASFDNLPRTSNIGAATEITPPYIFFPGRPSVDKGLPIFAAMAEELRADKFTCVAVKRPRGAMDLDDGLRAAPIVWLPWLCRRDLFAVMRRAACVVLPSITEGYGLATAESIRLGTPTLYQDVGGHHSLLGFPSAIPVPITIAERVLLYSLWSDLLMDHPDSWSVWRRHESSLEPLVDKWANAVRQTVDQRDVGTIKPEHVTTQRVEERWGNRLRDRIESDSLRPQTLCG